MFNPTYTIEVGGDEEHLTFNELRVMARNNANEYTSIFRQMTIVARRRLGARLALHEKLLSLSVQMANVTDGDDDLMVELVERRTAVVAVLREQGTAPRSANPATLWTLH